MYLPPAGDGNTKLCHTHGRRQTCHWLAVVCPRRRPVQQRRHAPVGDDIRALVRDWICYLRKELLFGLDDPLFPKTEVKLNAARKFEATGLCRQHWSKANPIRRIFRDAFERAGLPYFNPHSFRKTLDRLGETKCRTPEEFEAWSQNLRHEGVLTTFLSYGEVQPSRQSDISKQLQMPELASRDQDVDRVVATVVRVMRAQTDEALADNKG